MKKTKRIGTLLLASMLTATALSGFGANALYMETNVAPEGYTEFEDYDTLSFMAHVGDGVYVPYTSYQKETSTGLSLAVLSEYKFNYTEFVVTDKEAFQRIYAEYKNRLHMETYVEQDGYNTENSFCYICDTKTADGVASINPADYVDKTAMIACLCSELKAANAISACVYHGNSASISYGSYTNFLTVSGIADSEASAISEIVATYDSDASVEITDTEFKIDAVEDYNKALALSQELEKVYADSEVTPVTEFWDSSETIAPAELDLYDATDFTITKGNVDKDSDNKISINDAYQALLYSSNVSAGVTDPAFTDGSDATAEAAAFASADVNADGEITIDDAYRILKFSSTESAGGTGSWE